MCAGQELEVVQEEGAGAMPRVADTSNTGCSRLHRCEDGRRGPASEFGHEEVQNVTVGVLQREQFSVSVRRRSG